MDREEQTNLLASAGSNNWHVARPVRDLAGWRGIHLCGASDSSAREMESRHFVVVVAVVGALRGMQSAHCTG